MDEHQRFRVHPALAPYVASMHGYQLSGYRPGSHVGVPSAAVTCVFDLSEQLRVTTAAGVYAAHDASVSGIHVSPVTIQHDGHQHGIMLMLTAAGARALIGVPAGELANDVVSLADLLGPTADELIDRLRSAPGWSSLALLHHELLRRIPQTSPDSVGLAAWQVLQQSGSPTIAQLAIDSGWSERHLRATVRAELGHSAGALRRLLRFRRSLTEARLGDLATTAARSGYADQAHLSREWHGYLGMTPTEYLTLEEFVQI